MRRLQGGPRRVVVAMSGGVDSSTVAGMMVEAGHEVIGVMMKLYDHSDANLVPGTRGQCCSLDDVADARRVAEHLGIPFYVGNYRDAFDKGVMQPFVDAYLAGRTPNPCVGCNDTVKFKPLLARARALGADVLATGHYVRTVHDAEGRVELHEGTDPDKDQSYFVAGIPASALERVVFPLGELTKEEVREVAARLSLPVATKAESQDICFVPDGDYASFVAQRAGDRLQGEGPIVSVEGLRIGRHQGLHRYTVGQRRGLGVSAPDPLYVVGIRPDDNALVVGGREALLAHTLTATRARWLGSPPGEGARLRVKIRYRDAGTMATVRSVNGGRIEVGFDAPVAAVTPGQQLVLYDQTRVIGAATIAGRGSDPTETVSIHG